MIVGRPITDADHELYAALQHQLAQTHLRKRVTIQPATQDVLLPLLQRATVFVHASTTSLDKAVLEAMSSGCIVISTAAAVQHLLLPVCQATRQTLDDRIREICELPPEKRREIAAVQRKHVVDGHSLARLVKRLIAEMVS